MRILQINTHELKGGAAKVSNNLNSRFNEAGNSSEILSSDSMNSTLQSSQNSSLLNKILFYSDLYEFFGEQKIDTQGYDIVNLHNLHGGYFKLKNLINLSKQKPVVISIHDLWLLNGNYPYKKNLELNKFQNSPLAILENILYPIYRHVFEPTLKFIKSSIYRKSNFSVIVGSHWMEDLVKKSILKNHKIKFIPYGIDLNKYKVIDKREARKKLGLPQDKFIVCFSAHGGSSNKRKGFKYAVDVVKKLNSKDILFLKLGENQTSNNENEVQVKYTENTEFLNLYYSASDIYLFTSLIDNSPLSVLEVMASGTPVISFENGGAIEIIKNNRNGFLVEAYNTSEMARKIQLYMKNDKIHHEFRKNARSTVEQNHSLDLMAENYLKYYEEVINEFKKH